MNKIISTNERIFISLVGPSGSGKSRLIFDWLQIGTFQPEFDKIYYFYQHYQSLYGAMQTKIKNIEFVQGVDFDTIENLPNIGKTLLIFDDSCEEISSSKQFVKIATAGRHKGLSTIYIKHNLFHQSRLGRDIELQNTHIVLFKSPRDVLQINTLSQQLGLGSQLKEWYNKATSVPYGHLLVDLTPKTVDVLRYCTDSGTIPSKFFLPNPQTTFLDDEHTASIYTDRVPKLFPKVQKRLCKTLSKRLYPVSKRVYSKFAPRRTLGSAKTRRSKVPKRSTTPRKQAYKSTKTKKNSKFAKRSRSYKYHNTVSHY